MSNITGWEQFSADLARVHGEGFLNDFCKSILDEHEAEKEMIYARQQRIAAATERLEECWLDGMGECHMRLDADVYWHWVRREGRQIWNDKDFIKKFKRDNKDVIVKAKSRKTMVGYST